MKIWIILAIFLVLILLDKSLTVLNLTLAQKTNPQQYMTIEKNPAQKFFFENYGLLGGALIYGFLTLVTLLFAYYMLTFAFTPERSLWFIVILYSIVIGNNAFFSLKFGGLLS